MIRYSYLLVIFVVFLVFDSKGQNDIFAGDEYLFHSAKSYVIRKTADSISIDGLSNEEAWGKVEWINDFEDIEGESKPLPTLKTGVKILWDDDNLYFYVEIEEPQIWAYYTEHDQIVYHENDFEIFIDKERDTHHYFEYEFNALNTLFDLYMPRPYRNGGIPLITWDSPDLKSAVYIDGTINNANDTDKKWSLEVAIPFSDLRKGVSIISPKDGEIWKMNFSRVQWQTEIKNGKYVKKINAETGRFFPENNWVWNPQGIINMHYPERWGNVQFSEKPVGEGVVDFIPEKDDELRNHLWMVYYKQRNFFREHGFYALNLDELGIPERIVGIGSENYLLELTASKYHYMTLIRQSGKEIFRINNAGLILKRN